MRPVSRYFWCNESALPWKLRWSKTPPSRTLSECEMKEGNKIGPERYSNPWRRELFSFAAHFSRPPRHRRSLYHPACWTASLSCCAFNVVVFVNLEQCVSPSKSKSTCTCEPKFERAAALRTKRKHLEAPACKHTASHTKRREISTKSLNYHWRVLTLFVALSHLISD